MSAEFKKLPTHIAFIIDGNGRWAQKRGLIRTLGHRAGMNALKNVIGYTYDVGIKNISVFAFSTENWARPQSEIKYIFNLIREFIKSELDEFVEKYKFNFRLMGDYSVLEADLVETINDLKRRTKNNTQHTLNICLNYGSRSEILRAVNNIIKKNEKNINQARFEKYLYSHGLPDPDFVIRTSGEKRLSNFMLWQCAYSELYFPKVYWPDFNKKHLNKALKIYQKRNRRYGNVKEETHEK